MFSSPGSLITTNESTSETVLLQTITHKQHMSMSVQPANFVSKLFLLHSDKLLLDLMEKPKNFVANPCSAFSNSRIATGICTSRY